MRPHESVDEEDPTAAYASPPEDGDAWNDSSDDSSESHTPLPPQLLWGPEYTFDTCKYFLSTSKRNPFYKDEVFDFLTGEREGRPIYPHRLKHAEKKRRMLDDFKKNLERTWMVEDLEDEGEYVLVHEVKAGKRKDAGGERQGTFGWKIVSLTKEDALVIIAQVTNI